MFGRRANRAAGPAAPKSFAGRRPNPAESAWAHAKRAARKWAIGGAVVGAAIGSIAFAPAQWLAGAVAIATDRRLMLADAQGTIWSGSAVPLLTGGKGSRDASRLPGRLHWTVRPQFGFGSDSKSDSDEASGGLALRLSARHECCLNGTVDLLLRARSVTLLPADEWIAQWPSNWLAGLGRPWNLLQLGGALRLSSSGLTIAAGGPPRIVDGSLAIEILHLTSRMSSLPLLGSYRIELAADPAADDQPTLTLTTEEGALQLSGTGSWSADGFRFEGEASAADESDEEALGNLLDLAGQREGARAVISIG